MNVLSRFKYLSIYIFFIFSILILPSSVIAADQCPSSNGIITENTTWDLSFMVDGVYDCSETSLIVDNSILTIEIPFDVDDSRETLRVKEIRYKNDGKLDVIIVEPNIIESVYYTFDDPYSTSKAIATGSAGLQVVSVIGFLYSRNIGVASALGILNQMIFGISKMKFPWGIVYNTYDDEPVAFATVRLFNAKGNTLVATTVTDLLGRYGFITDPGDYYIQVSHDRFLFPSNIIKSITSLSNIIYRGETFYVKDPRVVNYMIPVDPIGIEPKLNMQFIRALWFKFTDIASVLNIYVIVGLLVLNIFLLIIEFSIMNFIITIVYLVIVFITLLKFLSESKEYGVVYDSKNKNPVSFAFIKLFNESNKELLDTQITDKFGRYQMFAIKGIYHLLVAAQGYKFPSIQNNQKLVFFNGLTKINNVTGVIAVDIPLDQYLPTDAAYSASTSTSPFG